MFYLQHNAMTDGMSRRLSERSSNSSNERTSGHDNPTFVGDASYQLPGESRRTSNMSEFYPGKYAPATIQVHDSKDKFEAVKPPASEKMSNENDQPEQQRDSWGKGIEFLLSCIAMSVGLGNIWRFPFVAAENGGGAFVIPYLIVLVIVGKPVYFLEMAIGQFSSRGSVKVFDCVPAMRGVGVGQVVSVAVVATYYSSLMALTLKYFADSFQELLPWSYCRPEWADCKPSMKDESMNMTAYGNDTKTSAYLYFNKIVLHSKDDLSDGIGYPSMGLVACLAISWGIVFLTLVKGVRSSGKASYVLAIFPYLVLGVLFGRAITLPGAWNGIGYFFNPQWEKMMEPGVWYAAVTQVFFSLSVCFGNIIMYSSYNKFSHNVYRDANIVTTLDTFTSLLAGSCIFGILGNLAHELNDDVENVVKGIGGTGLAFISYPDAISKFESYPQVYAVLFFLMLYMLGVGSNVAMMSCIMTVIRDRFQSIKNWQVALVIAITGTALGSIYMTPGGQAVLKLVDFYGASFTAFILAIGELYAFSYIYGVDRLCRDIEFMLGFRPNFYWRVCWKYLTPGLMTAILIYFFAATKSLPQAVDADELTGNPGIDYPVAAHVIGFCVTCLGLVPLPLFAVYAIIKQKESTVWRKIIGAFRPNASWGPADPTLNAKYKDYINVMD